MARERAEETFAIVGCSNVDAMAAGLYLDLGLGEEHALLGPLISRIPHLMEIYLRETTEVRLNNYIGLQEREIKKTAIPTPKQNGDLAKFEQIIDTAVFQEGEDCP